MTDAPMPYNAHRLGDNAEDVLKAFYTHPGQADLKPFGRMVMDGIEFALDPVDGRLYTLVDGGRIPMGATEEARMVSDLRKGFVELYLRRPGTRRAGASEPSRVLLHAATGRHLPATQRLAGELP